LAVSDIKTLVELLHKCKFDDNLPEYATVITVYNDLKSDLISDIHARVTIYEFTHWMAVHPLLIAPLTKLQQHLRKQILGGESFWMTITQQRKDHLEQNRLDFLKTLKTQVLSCKIGSKPKNKGKEKNMNDLSPTMKQRKKLTTISPTTMKDDVPTEPTILYTLAVDTNESRKRAHSSPTTVTTTPSSDTLATGQPHSPHHHPHHGNNNSSHHKPVGRGRVYSADQADSHDLLLDSHVSHSPIRKVGSNEVGEAAFSSPSPHKSHKQPMIIKYEVPSAPVTTPSSKKQKVVATAGTPEVKSRKHHH
jgi:hypothetical protein